MEIKEMVAFEGPNVHSHYPVIQAIVDLGEFDNVPTKDINGFNQHLLKALPSLVEHQCSLGRPGGFVQRLNEGTLLGHALEHTILELQALAGMDAIYGKTRWTGRPGLYRIVYEYQAKEAALEAARLATAMFNNLIAGRDIRVEPVVEQIKRIAAETEPGPSTVALLKACRDRGIPYLRLGSGSLYQLGYGWRQKRIQATVTGLSSCIGADVAADKSLTKELLAASGIPVPYGGTACGEDASWELARSLLAEGIPSLAVKPECANQGKGVSLRLVTEEEVRRAYRLAASYGPKVVVEWYIPGRHYRLLVVGDQVAAASERLAAHIVGDGQGTLAELVDQVNRDPLRGEDHEKPLTKIKIDEVVRNHLARVGLTLNYRPARGEVVYLRENANLSTGGVAIDVTNEVHPENALIAIRAARAVGLDVAGIDLVATNIALPITQGGGAIIEVNACPGIRMHHHPSRGRPRDAAGAIIDHLFPKGSPSRIPLVSVTGTNGKTTVSRLIAHFLACAGVRVGLCTTDGISIGGQMVLKGDTTGPRSARTVLMDPTVEAAVLETARGGILRGGLSFESCDVAVVTNVSDDHLGQDEIQSIEDLADLKCLVAEMARPDGYAVLNADDPLVAQMAERLKAPVIYFSLGHDSMVIAAHRAAGGRAMLVKNGQIIMAQGRSEQRLVAVKAVPVALDGHCRHQLANCLAGAAAGWGLGLESDLLRTGLKSFGTGKNTNPGRFNLYEAGDFRVIIDYGHNPAGLREVFSAARELQPSRLVGVVGLPGDRSDEAARQLGRVAGSGLDYVYIKEDRDRRGRRLGEVADLLLEGVLDSGIEPNQVEIILDEVSAAEAALEAALPGDLVLIFYEKYEPVVDLVTRWCRKDFGRRGERMVGGL